jgi:hypothetical protein
MTLSEIVDLSIQQRNVQRLKKNAERQAEQAKAAQARLKMQKAKQELSQAGITPEPALNS